MTERLYFHFSLSCIGEGNGNPLQCSCLENPRDGGTWWAAVCGVAQSWTWLKRLSSSSSSSSNRLRMIRQRETEERILSSGIDWDLGKTGSAFASTVSRSRSISSFFLALHLPLYIPENHLPQRGTDHQLQLMIQSHRKKLLLLSTETWLFK